MKICYLTRSLESHTGVGRFCLSLLAGLKKEFPDAEFTILTGKPSGHVLETSIIHPNKFRALLAIPKIRSILKKHDIIHALDGWPYGFIAALASFGLKKKLIVTAVGTGAVRPLYLFPKRWLLSWAYRRADHVVAVSNNTKKEILKVAPDLNIQVVNHGVDFNAFNKNAAVRAEVSRRVSAVKPYILSVGALKQRKGYEFSIRAFAEVAPRFPALKYVLFGADYSRNKSEYHRLRGLIERLGIADRVIFESYDRDRGIDQAVVSDEELAYLYKNAELFILLSQDFNKDIEGFGLVFLEAAACGLPVIATRETSAEDAVASGKNGILVSPGDYREAAAAIIKILSEPTLKKLFSRESLAFAKKMSWQKAAASYSKIYKNS